MSRALTDFLVCIRYVLGAGALRLVGGRATTLLTGSNQLHTLSYHVRLAQPFYGTGLTLITGFDVSSKDTCVVYEFLLGGTTHLSVAVLCGGSGQLYSIEDSFINATWYERETSEMLGVSFVGSKDGRALLLPYNNSANPLKKIMPSNSTATLGYSRLAESLA